jgi:hypothetical protein
MHQEFLMWCIWHPILTAGVAWVAFRLDAGINRGKPINTRERGKFVLWWVIASYFFGGCFGLAAIYSRGNEYHPLVVLCALFGLVLGVISGNLVSLLLVVFLWEPRDPDVPPRETDHDPDN